MAHNVIYPCYELPLDVIRSGGINSPCAFAIANYVLQYPEYATYYQRLVNKGLKVILDNGLHETGNALDFTQLDQAIDILGRRPNLYVIAPDKLHDAHWTYSHSIDFQDRLKIHGVSLAAVAQGSTPDIAYELYKQLIAAKFKLICLPFKADRPEFLRRYPLRYDIPHHLLGSYGVEEIRWLRKYICLPFSTSIDTAKPIKAGIENTPLEQYTRGRGTWKIDTSLTPEQLERIHSNIHLFDFTCRAHYTTPTNIHYNYQKP